LEKLARQRYKIVFHALTRSNLHILLKH
jgi:hypothetical protein